MNVQAVFTKADLANRVAAVPWWYHKIDLGNGLITPGWSPNHPQLYNIPRDLTGKRVLDVGAWDGYWTFEAMRRGAAYVLAIDDFSDADNAMNNDGLAANREAKLPRWHTFDLCREALGYAADRCERRELSVYDVPAHIAALREQPFDVIFFFGVLYHLKHPLLALERLVSVLSPGGHIYIESAVLDDYSAYLGYGEKRDSCRPVMEFYPTDEYGGNPTNWWCPSVPCIGSMLKSLGVTDVVGWRLEGPEDLGIQDRRGWVTGRLPDAADNSGA